MARERGFAVTIKAWVPIKGNDANSVASAALAANGTNNDLHLMLEDQGFLDIEITSSFTSKKKPVRIEIDDDGLFKEPALNALADLTKGNLGQLVPDNPWPETIIDIPSRTHEDDLRGSVVEGDVDIELPVALDRRAEKTG